MVEKLYSVYFSQIVSIILPMTGNKPEAEDVTQEAFIKALANLGVLSELSENQCKSWLIKTAKNLWIDRVRRKKFSEPSSGEAFNDDLSVLAVSELLDNLPKEERDLFCLRYFCGYNSRELGKMYGIPEGTVRYKLSTARQKLRTLCAEAEKNEKHPDI